MKREYLSKKGRTTNQSTKLQNLIATRNQVVNYCIGSTKLRKFQHSDCWNLENVQDLLGLRNLLSCPNLENLLNYFGLRHFSFMSGLSHFSHQKLFN